MSNNQRTITISTAPSRMATHWANKVDTWNGLCERLSRSTETPETVEEYAAADKETRARIKDVGGFVGGALTDGIRRAGHCLTRDVITLDIDRLGMGDEERLCKIAKQWCCCIYSTHSHTSEFPRLRLVLLPSRQILRDEYEPVAKSVADEIESRIGEGCVDSTTFEPERLMYWPSHSKGSAPYFRRFYGSSVDVDAALTSDVGLRATAEVAERRSRGMLVDPRQRGGIIGATCEAYYPITKLFDGGPLTGYYVKGERDRWSWATGKGRNGVRIYDDGLFIYSDHDTDPAHGRCCNAFDLLRIHLYNGDLDATLAYCASIPEVAAVIRGNSFEGVEIPEEEEAEQHEASDAEKKKRGRPKKNKWTPKGDWTDSLERDDRTGRLLTNASNLQAIFTNDIVLKGLFRLNQFNKEIVLMRPRPWDPKDSNLKLNNTDMACLRNYLDKEYGLSGKEKIQDAFDAEILRNAFNPVVDLIREEAWDGEARCEALFIDWLGADDTVLNRAMSKKWLTAAVARALNPGCKFDYMLILQGPEGCGKSTIFEKLGGEYHTNRIGDIRTKESLENIAGKWVVECGELGSLLAAEQEYIKNFFSSSSDSFRPAYGRYVEGRPRTAVFCGTTNEDKFAKGTTGNRRYWIITVDPSKRKHSIAELFSSFPVKQIWAEALIYYQAGEMLALSPELEAMAKAIQRGANAVQNDPWYDDIKYFLELHLPDNWQSWSLEDRKKWLKDESGIRAEGVRPRTEVCYGEIFAEVLDIPRNRLTAKESFRIKAILVDLGWKFVNKTKRIARYIGAAKYFMRAEPISIENHEDKKESTSIWNQIDFAEAEDDY